MAKKRGKGRREGDNLSRYTDKNGNHIVRRKGGPCEKTIFSSPGMGVQRSTIKAMVAASKLSKLLRDAFAPLLREVADTTIHPRLTKLLFAMIKENETAHEPFAGYPLAALNHFSFHGKVKATDFFSISGAAINQAMECVVDIAVHLPPAVKAACWYQVETMIAGVDISGNVPASFTKACSAHYAVTENETIIYERRITITQALPDTTHPVFFGALLRFYLFENGRYYLLAQEELKAGSLFYVPRRG
jgi:hypothetical protein